MFRRLVTSESFRGDLKLASTVTAVLISYILRISMKLDNSPKTHKSKHPNQDANSFRTHIFDRTNINSLTVVP